MSEGGYLSRRRAAERLHVCPKTIDRLRSAGELDAIKLSDGPRGRVRISLASLEAYEERRAQAAAGAELERDRFPIPALEALWAARAERLAATAAAAGREEVAA